MEPKRSAPITSRTTPTITANNAAAAMYSSVSVTNPPPCSAPSVSRLVSATGPVWRYGDEANSENASSGNAEAKRPMNGGSPARPAYARLCGISTSATVTPPITSPNDGVGKDRSSAV